MIIELVSIKKNSRGLSGITQSGERVLLSKPISKFLFYDSVKNGIRPLDSSEKSKLWVKNLLKEKLNSCLDSGYIKFKRIQIKSTEEDSSLKISYDFYSKR